MKAFRCTELCWGDGSVSWKHRTSGSGRWLHIVNKSTRINLFIADIQSSPNGRKGDDPDSFIRREGPAAFKALINNAKPWGEWRFAREESHLTDSTDTYTRTRIVHLLLPVVRSMADPIVHAHYIHRLALIGQVDDDVIEMMITNQPFKQTPIKQTKPVTSNRGGVEIP